MSRVSRLRNSRIKLKSHFLYNKIYPWAYSCTELSLIILSGSVLGETFDLLGCNVLCGSSGVLLSQVSEQLTQISVERD